jgi:hypothetical protein
MAKLFIYSNALFHAKIMDGVYCEPCSDLLRRIESRDLLHTVDAPGTRIRLESIGRLPRFCHQDDDWQDQGRK